VTRLGGVWCLVVAALAIGAIGTGLWRLEAARTDLVIERTRVAGVPVTLYRPISDMPAPVVLLGHGFAGSQQLMQPFATTLSRNGYIAITFDFPGHGRNAAPFVARIEDQARRVELLLGALEAVAAFAGGLPGTDGRMALLGHSMAGDVLLRYAAAHREEVAATVLISPYLAADSPTREPRNLLLVYGSWEPEMLSRTGAQAVTDAVGEPAETGVYYGDFGDGSARRLVLVEGAEHIAVLYARAALSAGLDWLNRVFGRSGNGFIDDRGPALAMLFLGLLVLARPLSRRLPRSATAPMGAGLGWRRLMPVAVAPALLTPLILRLLPTDYLPILLGDYLALHFGVYGSLTAAGLLILRRRGGRKSPSPPQARLLRRGLGFASLGACAYATLAFAMPLDRYLSAFLPDATRIWLLLAILPGTWAYFAADGWLAHGPGAPRLAPALTKVLFLLSLLMAVALDLRGLFFLIIIVPAILVFFLVYGLMGEWVYRRTRHPLPGALAAGLMFAWAIAVTFPLVGA
jgi:dienelactone hydrolase